MPVYNTEHWIDEAIKSVCAQTYPSFELIIIDDGSTDGSLEKIRYHEKLDSRISVFCQENRGPGGARNKGLQESNGQFVYFMDSDDILMPDTLAYCLTLASENNLDLITFSAEVVSEVSQITKAPRFYQKPDLLNPILGQELLLFLQAKRSYSCVPYLYFFSRDLIFSMSSLFDENCFHEDEGFAVELYCISQKSISLKKQLFRRRYRANSVMTGEQSWKHVEGLILAVERIQLLSKKQDIIKPITRIALHIQQLRTLQRAYATAKNIDQYSLFLKTIQKRLKINSSLIYKPVMIIYFYIMLNFYRLIYLPYYIKIFLTSTKNNTSKILLH